MHVKSTYWFYKTLKNKYLHSVANDEQIGEHDGRYLVELQDAKDPRLHPAEAPGSVLLAG